MTAVTEAKKVLDEAKAAFDALTQDFDSLDKLMELLATDEGEAYIAATAHAHGAALTAWADAEKVYAAAVAAEKAAQAGPARVEYPNYETLVAKGW